MGLDWKGTLPLRVCWPSCTDPAEAEPCFRLHHQCGCLPPLTLLPLPGRLRRVPSITGERLTTMRPPPSLLRAGILAPSREVKQWGRSPVPVEDVIATRSCPLYAGGSME